MDTKADEINFVADCIRKTGFPVVTVDVGTSAPATKTPDIGRQQVLDSIGVTEFDLRHCDRGTAVGRMSEALDKFLQNRFRLGEVAGVIGIGGSGGTALITAAMRSMDVGLPKLMVSTVASGNTAPYIDCSDIVMMYSVVDIAGLNRVSRKVLANAAYAIAGMAAHPTPNTDAKHTVGMTMFGVTTPCINSVRNLLEPRGYECLVFHATGTGGRTMEHLVESGLVEGALDLTTTEVADEIAGGIFACGSQRFDRMINKRIPLVLSLGALDMVNFGAIETVPDHYKDRNLYVHNANITLMRTSVEENIKAASWIAAKLNRSDSPWTLLIPKAGISALDQPDQPFYHPESNQALFDTLHTELKQTSNRKIIDLPYHINDTQFATAAVDAYLEISQHQL